MKSICYKAATRMKKILGIVLILLILLSCKKQQEYPYPLIFTGDVTNITSNGANFNAKIVDLNKIQITEYGFVWDLVPNPTIDNSEKYVIHETPKAGVISASISTTLQQGVTYFVRAFVRNSDYISYGKQVTFNSLGSLAPKITDFMPKTGKLNDTIKIVGHNFSYKTDENIVKFAGFKTKVIKSNQDTLWVIVPTNLNSLSSLISVSIQGNEVSSTDKFNLIAPVITDFQARTASFGSQVTIYGKNFMSNPTTLYVCFDKYVAKVNEVHSDYIIVTVPDSLNKWQCNIRIGMNNLVATSTDLFNLKMFTINDFSPKVALTGNTITVTGSGFSPLSYNNKVKIGGFDAYITNTYTNKLEVILPQQWVGSYITRNVKIDVEVLGENKEYDKTLLINDKWFRLKDSPVSNNLSLYPNYGYFNYFVYKEKVYTGLNNQSQFWEYNPANDSWKKLADFPGIPRLRGVGFVIDGKIYFGTGFSNNNEDLKDWWVYDINTNTWSQKKDFTGNARSYALAFSIGNSGYVGGGTLRKSYIFFMGFRDFWKYSPADDSWIKVTDYPMSATAGIWNGTTVVNNNCAYISLVEERLTDSDYNCWMYKYNPSDNSWQRLANVPFQGFASYSFVFDGKIYIPYGAAWFYSYTDSSNSWTKVDWAMSEITSDINEGIGFTSGGKIYVGLGSGNSIWECDPSR